MRPSAARVVTCLATVLWRARIPLCYHVPYGRIAAEVVTHRLLLLDGSHFPASVYDGTTSHDPWQNTVAKVSGSAARTTDREAPSQKGHAAIRTLLHLCARCLRPQHCPAAPGILGLGTIRFADRGPAAVQSGRWDRWGAEAALALLRSQCGTLRVGRIGGCRGIPPRVCCR